MCEWKKSGNQRIDPCMRHKIHSLQNTGIEPKACCCGHGKYPATIIVRSREGVNVEYYSGVIIQRKKRFYRRDSVGMFFIPETMPPTQVEGILSQDAITNTAK